MSSEKIKKAITTVVVVIVLILLAWAGFMYEQNDFKEWQEENPGGSWWEYQMDWKWQNSW